MNDGIDDKLEELAEHLLDEALKEGDAEVAMPVDRKIDAFKAISVYRIAVRRLKPKEPDDPEDGNDIDAMKRRLRDADAEGLLS